MEELLERYLILKQNLSIEIYADFLQYLSTVEVYTVVRKVEGVENFNYISFKGNQSKYLAIFSCEETKKAFLDKNKCSIKKCKFMTLANRVIEDNTTGIVIDPISENMYFVIEQQDLITMVLSEHLTKINDAKNIKKKYLYETFLRMKSNIYFCDWDSYERYKVGSILIEERSIACVNLGIRNIDFVRCIIFSNQFLIEEDSPFEYIEGESKFLVLEKIEQSGQRFIFLLHLADGYTDELKKVVEDYIKMGVEYDSEIMKYDRDISEEKESKESIKKFFKFNIGFN